MQAALMYGPEDIRVEEIPKPPCPEDGLLLKVQSVGICGSDLRNMLMDSRKGNYPHIYGHEIVGVVDEIGVLEREYRVGERLYIYPADHCLHCEPCRSGHSESCGNQGDYTERQGGFADYVTVTAEQIARDSVFRLPEGVSADAASLSEPLSSVYACQENIDIRLGDSVVIIGAGPIGCFHTQLAKMRGAAKVIVVEINDRRLEMTKEFGADALINSAKEDVIARVKELTNGRGADKVISANPSVEAQAQSIFLAKDGGIVVFFGGVAKGKLCTLDTNYVHYHNLWIYGHFGASSIQVQRAFELAISKDFPAEKFITHRLPLREIQKGIDLNRSGEAIKVVLHPNT
ncbi:zinc-dependent dehydrogenase [Selenomonas sp. TAMA-11512]|uniref:zinc-binding dehydrogenase n=1 Tax=Selenomonas sp. TAMA-11512 TaxID=3095337 RepID=UPI00308979E2|nr:zinc-dependent dehydrogenase [Selenomonas sp. TAMA-11512]